MVNITMALKISEEDKAEVFASRIIQSASFRPDGTVEDNEMSMMIALGNLARLEDKDVKSRTIDKILTSAWPKVKTQEYFQLLRDYFPDGEIAVANIFLADMGSLDLQEATGFAESGSFSSGER